MKNIKYIVVLFLLLFIATANAQSTKDKTEKHKLVKSTFTVKGMTCQGCVNTVKNVINNIDGVAGSEVKLKSGEATVKYDPSKTNPESIKNKFKDLPYKLDEKKMAVNQNKEVNKNGK